MRIPFEIHLALRYLRFHRGRTFLSVITLISVAGVTVGTAALVIALALNTGFQEDVRERILGGSAHLTVLAMGEDTFPDAEAMTRRVNGCDGVRATGPVLFTPAMISNEEVDSTAYAELMGVDPTRHGRVMAVSGTGGDSLASLARRDEGGGPQGILLGEELARRLAARVGDRIRVLVPRLTLTPFAPIPRSRSFRVIGTFRSEYFQQDAQRAYIGIEDARTLLDAPSRASWIEVRLDDLRDLERGKAAIRREIGPQWIVADLIEQNQAMLKALNTEKMILFLAIGLIVVVAALNIVSTLILMVTDKVKEIGTLCAMGAVPRRIAAIFMLQGLVIGIVGTALGLVVGTSASWWMDRFEVIRLNPEVYYLDHVPFAARGSDLAVVAALTVAVSFLATLYPAWRAATQDPVEAIRHE